MTETAAVLMGAAIAAAARDRSTVEFPYADLDEGISIVRAIHQGGGLPMDRDQIAARLGQKATSGAFISKISAARQFGLVDVQSGSGKIQITPLGHEVIAPDDTRQRAARAQAFLNVELYRKLYDEFRNRHLPPRPHGLEQALVGMGVAPKQRTNARYAFDRSAKQAGFFDHGQDRLVAPVTGSPAGPMNQAEIEAGALAGHAAALAVAQSERQLDGVITALIDKLPTDGGEDWGITERVAWLTMMSMAFDMAYGRKGEIMIKEGTGTKPAFTKAAVSQEGTETF